VLIGIVAVVLDDPAEARRELAELTGRSTGPATIAAFSSGNCSSRPSPPSPAYAGKLVDWAKQHLNLTAKPVSRPRTTLPSSCCPAAGSSRGRSRG